MSGESSKRSSLIDITYQNLHTYLANRLEGTTLPDVSAYLKHRVDQLQNLSKPFGTPSDASKKKVESGSVALRDGTIIRVENDNKEYVFAISKEFNIDEVEALILLRSFLYNEGLPPSDEPQLLIEELLRHFTPFYYSERLYAIRVLIPLLSSSDDQIKKLAVEYVPRIAPDPKTWALKLLSEYLKRTQESLPVNLDNEPKKASLWVKENAKVQLVLLEVLFWSMWENVPATGPVVYRFLEVAYATNMGSLQQNGNLLLDDEGVQLLQDSAALWILILIEVLELERAATGISLNGGEDDSEVYWSSPDHLTQIHDIIISHDSSQFACVFLSWAFILSQLDKATNGGKDVPPAYSKFISSILPQIDRSYSKDREPVHALMTKTCLDPDAGLFQLLLTLLTNTPLFVASLAWKTGSAVTDPNAVAFRSVLKGLIIALLELVPVELIPQFDAFVEVWVALFGGSESRSVGGICDQYWQVDWAASLSRRAILEVARSRFPVQPRPLLRLLRAMSGAGSLDNGSDSVSSQPLTEERVQCSANVFAYFHQLSTYTTVVPSSACTGGHALYEKLPERYVASGVSTGLTYANLRPLKLPGGSTLPVKSIGRPLNGDAGDFVAILWKHEHSGWKVLLEILTDYVNRRRLYAGGSSHHDVSFGKRGDPKVTALKLEDIHVEMDPAGDEDVIIDALDLIRGVAHDNPDIAEEILTVLESGDHVVAHSTTESTPPDLVQLTTMILEEALSRSSPQHRTPPRTALITSALGVLSALLSLPKYSNRVWLYIRSTASLFGSEQNIGITSTVLAAERLTGQYNMSLALLSFVQQLFNEAASTVAFVLQEHPKMQQVKEEVLIRATRFVHSEIWIEHVGWKYAHLSDRFEIGRRVSSLYNSILKHSPPEISDAPFSKLSQGISDALLARATMSTVHPLVSAISSGNSVLSHLFASRRYDDARRLIYMMDSHLRLTRTILSYKPRSPYASQICLLEEVLCERGNGNSSGGSNSSRTDPIDALAAYVKHRGMGSEVPIFAALVLFALCSSLSACDGMAPTIIGHLSDPEGTVNSFVRIIMHPYDDISLRRAVWNFITLAVDKEPALANLFVTGHIHTPSIKGKEKVEDKDANTKHISALSISIDMLERWKDLWELNPLALASLIRFLNVVWEHGHEHKAALQPVRQNKSFWDLLAAIVKEELGPVPDYIPETFQVVEGVQHSDLHDAVSVHSLRTIIKSHALNIFGLDVRMAFQAQGDKGASTKPPSYQALQGTLQSADDLTDLIGEAASRTYDPSLSDDLDGLLQKHFRALVLDQLRVQDPLVERDFGDEFVFSLELAQERLQSFEVKLQSDVDAAARKLCAINLNLSLANAQTALTQSWQYLLIQVVPFLRGVTTVRPTLLALAESISADLASERRSGNMMATVHHARLSLLLALLEVAWFSTTEKKEEIAHFIALVKNVRGIILNSAQSPAKSFLGQVTIPFHRAVLQIAYFCIRHGRTLWLRSNTLNAEQRLTIISMVEYTLIFVIDALRVSFEAARTKLDLDVDQDLELLVAVFEQSTRLDFNSSPNFWLTRCQETDLIQTSLELFSRMDLVGFADLSLLRTRKQVLYAPHVLTFHTALASIPSAAERLASEGILVAYSENPISGAIKAGSVDVALSELPNERSPAHTAYCSMLSVVAGVTKALGRHSSYFDSEVSGLVQLWAEQIHRALSWTNSDPLTLPLLEEIEQVVNLFAYIAQNSPRGGQSEAVHKALSFFTNDALLLLQQVNYALTHPNHLASLFEPITSKERTDFEADSQNKSSVSSPTDVVDPMRRPFLAKLVHRFFKLSSSLLNTLIAISGAETVLTGEPEDWPSHQTLVVPHSKVVLGEPTSIGTLLELGNCSLDILRALVDRPAMQALTPATSVNTKALDVRDSVTATRRTLESVLFYIVTQLALWLVRADTDATPNDLEGDDNMGMGYGRDHHQEKDRRPKRQPLTLAERFRRGMSGEMASDVQALLIKARPVMSKSEGILAKKSIDLTPVLSRFVQERILS